MATSDTISLGAAVRLPLSPEKQIVLRFLEAMARQDVDEAEGLLVEEARWWVPGSAIGRLARPLLGARAGAELATGKTLGSFQPGSTRWRVHHLLSDGEMIAAHMNRHALTRGGQPYDVEYNWLFRLEGQRIAEVWEIMDTSEALARLSVPA